MNYWPTEDQSLLLRAGLLSGDAAIEAWHQVEPRLDLQRLDQASRRLLPLVYANLRRHAPSAGRLADLREAYSTTWLWNQRLLGCARQVVDALRAGRDVILKIDVQGAQAVKSRVPDALLIFLVPPSLETLFWRLRSRATETADELEVRQRNAAIELARQDDYDHVVVNETGQVDRTAARIDEIVAAERARLPRRRIRL